MNEYFIPYSPTPKQYMFHQSPAYEALFGGAAGPGKTCASIIDAFARCYQHSGTVAHVFRRTRPELLKSVIPEMLKWYPKGSYTYNSADGVMVLPNGSRIFLSTCQHEKDKHNYQGAEIDWLYIDELTHFTKSIYDYLKTRVRTSKGIQPCIRCTSNPGGVGHGWVKKYFVDAGPFTSLIPEKTWVESRKRFEITTRQYIPALVTENPYINDSYILELERKPEALRRALLLGEWDAFEGQVFVEFTDDPDHYLDRVNTHVIEPFDIPPHWKRYRGFDWGYITPFAVVWVAVEPGTGRLYVYREYYGSESGDNVGMQMPSVQLARNIYQIEATERMEGIRILGFADPSIFDAKDGEGSSVGDRMAREHVYFEKADNARLSGKEQFHSRFMFDEFGRPGMQIFNNCPNLIRTLQNLPYSQKNVEDVDTDAEDHCLTGDTLVVTEWGKLPIAELVGKEGKVLSSDGNYHKFFDCRMTQESAPLLAVEMEDGTVVKATPNHRFMLENGEWKRADELREGDELKCV